MPLNVRNIKGKEYLYYLMGSSKRIYLGTADNPKKDRVKEAIFYARNQIKEQEEELKELENLIHIKKRMPVPSYSPKYKLIVFDVDGVIFDKPWYEISSSISENVAISTWDILFQQIGMYNVHERYAKRYANGEYEGYMNWTEDACAYLKSYGLKKEIFDEIINRRPLSYGSKELFEILRNYKIKTALITGGFDALAKRASKELGGVDYIHAHCKFIFNKDDILYDCDLNKVDYEDKCEIVKSICEKNNIPLKYCAYVGDDVNDLDVFQIVGLAIAFNSKKIKVQQAAHIVIESKDLTAILPHLYVEKKPFKKFTKLTK